MKHIMSTRISDRSDRVYTLRNIMAEIPNRKVKVLIRFSRDRSKKCVYLR